MTFWRRNKKPRERRAVYTVASAELGWADAMGRPLTKEEIDDLADIARKVREAIDNDRQL